MELKMHFHIVVTLQVFDFFLFPNCHCFSCWPHIFGYLQYKIYIPKHLIGFSNLVNSAWKNFQLTAHDGVLSVSSVVTNCALSLSLRVLFWSTWVQNVEFA